MPLILVTNDDGIGAPGVKALAAALGELGRVVVIAPQHQQSAASHKVTLDRPLRVRESGADRLAVAGTPVDAVFLGLHKLLPKRPDLVVSGINHGLNIGTDIFYSGTVAAAMEAALKGIPAIAVSQQLVEEGAEIGMARLLEHTAGFAATVARAVLTDPPDGKIALNINSPACICSHYRWTRAGERVYSGEVIERVDPRGNTYFWFGGAISDPDGPVGSDSRAIRDGLISISALAPDWNAEWPTQPVRWSLDGFGEARQ